MSIIIGLTGMSGSGKSTVADIFRECGAQVFDCDSIARDAVSDLKVKADLVAQFGNDIIDNKGELNRSLLASRAFIDNTSVKRLNAITHPYILSDLIRRINTSKADVCIIDAPLLFPCGIDKICDVTISVTASRKTLIRRIIERDDINISMAESRLKAQQSMEEMFKKADYIIENNDDDLLTLSKKTMEVYYAITARL